MATEEEQPPMPELHEVPSIEPPKQEDKPGGHYVPADQSVDDKEGVDDIAGLIGMVHGSTTQLDGEVIGDNKFVKANQLDAKGMLTNMYNQVGQNPGPSPQPQGKPTNAYAEARGLTLPPATPVQPPAHLHPQPYPPPNPGVGGMDALILKQEIDDIKNNVLEIKKLYDEFFKLKVLKGSWTIVVDGKAVTAPSVAKAWNTINKALKSKKKSITITYNES
jgi:hypothetical protein